MTSASKPDRSATADLFDSSIHWEERSANRGLDTGHDLVLERSRQIVEAAYELLEESGLEGLTIRAVLNKTGLSRRAFYERFEGKDDLVLAVFEQTIHDAAVRFSEQVVQLADPLARLELLVTYIVLGGSALTGEEGYRGRRGAALSREHLRLAESRPADLQVALAPLINLIARLLEDGMARGQVRPGNPQRLAALVYNLVSTTVHAELLAQESAQTDQAPRNELAAEIWEFCRRAVAA